MKRLLASLVLGPLWLTQLAAQSAGETPGSVPLYITSPIFLDTSVGLGIGSSGMGLHAMASAGYRFVPGHGVGLEWRTASDFNSYVGTGGSGIGLRYRYQRGSFIGAASVGKLYNAYQFEDFFTEWEYTGKGRYAAIEAAWQSRQGVTLGLQLTSYRAQYDSYFPEDFDPDQLVYQGTDTENGLVLTISVGYAFPRRPRK